MGERSKPRIILSASSHIDPEQSHDVRAVCRAVKVVYYYETAMIKLKGGTKIIFVPSGISSEGNLYRVGSFHQIAMAWSAVLSS